MRLFGWLLGNASAWAFISHLLFGCTLLLLGGGMAGPSDAGVQEPGPLLHAGMCAVSSLLRPSTQPQTVPLFHVLKRKKVGVPPQS